MSFFVFCEFLLNEKSEVNFFWPKRSALKKGIQEKNFCRRFERNCGDLLFRMSGIQA
jgi:hypothetical protein